MVRGTAWCVAAGIAGVLAIAVGAAPAVAAPSTAPALTQATFADPPTEVRPKYRWWLPLAYEDDAELVDELRQMKAAGAGGAEAVGFAVAGAGNQSRSFLETYGWGTPLWAHRMETIYGAAKDLDMRVDMTIGPRWPALVPTVSDVNDRRAAQQLVFSHEFHEGGDSRDGALPVNYDTKPPAGARTTLVAALVARCEDPDCATQAAPRLLERASVTDVTDRVAEDGTLEYAFSGDGDDTYALIAFWQTASGETRSGLTATTPNFYLDHLSEAGARASTDFWDEHVLTPTLRGHIAAIGDADVYEDSLELGNTQKWTWDFVQQWERRRGYSPVELLPALAHVGMQGVTGRPFFDFGAGVGERVRTDYRQTWSDLYVDERLRTLREWTGARGMSLRAQPYGGPVDTAEASRHVDVPEGESLAFNNNIEDYKLVASGAHLEDRPVVSNECCAMREAVWATTAAGHADPANLRAVYRGFAGGVTQVVWHGFPYKAGGPPGSGWPSLWPGWSYGGNTSFAEAWGPKGGPNWEDYRSINDALARMQLVLRQGRPRFDLAVYWQDFGMDGHGTTGVGSNTLLRSTSPLAGAGYTYEYVSPATLAADQAVVRDGVLFPDRSGYRALLVKDQETMSVAAARALLARARDGLAIVITGDLPTTTPGYRDAAAQDAELRDVLAELVAQPRVVRVAEEADVPAALERLGVEPAAAHATDSPAMTSVRRRADGVDYYFLHNQTATATEQTLTLAGEGRAYALDPWTGEIAPLVHRVRGGRLEVDARLEGDDVAVIAVTRRDLATRDEQHGGAAGGHGAAPAPARLDDWTLAVESWTRGPSGQPGDTQKEPLPELQVHGDGALPAWSAFESLRDVSGVGTYTATVRLGKEWAPVTGAHLDLGRVVDTARVAVNGHALPPLNPQDVRHVEVGPYLRPGENTIRVRVASTLLNAVRVAPGTGASGRARMDYGLLGPVTLTPHRSTRPLLAAEALETALPLADGGYNRVRVRIVNGGRSATRVALDAVPGSDAVSARPREDEVLLRGGESRTIAVDLRADGIAAGATPLALRARGANGTEAAATVELRHSDDLARNALGTPFPAISASSNQDRYPAENLVDGAASTFWVSGGLVPGQGPTPDDPVYLREDFGAPVRIGSVTVAGRTNYGPRGYDVQVSDDGRTWETVATVAGAPKSGSTATFEPVTTRLLRVRITDGYYTATPGNNVQSSALEVRAP